jgi:hypothetical protein
VLLLELGEKFREGSERPFARSMLWRLRDLRRDGSTRIGLEDLRIAD